MKKFTAMLLAFLMVLSSIPAAAAANPVVPQDPIPRGSYTLAPTMFGATGIDTLTSFILQTPAGYATRYPNVSIDGQPQPTVTRQDASTFLIRPGVPLSYNSLYIVRVAGYGREDITWAFQTTVRFQITSTLPRNQATNVPRNTGIEINFSIEGDTNIADYFSIYPPVEGRFIRDGNTAIFMPASPLAHQQIYTVTIATGVNLLGTSERTSAAHEFAFETVPYPTPVVFKPIQTPRNARLHFANNYIDFPSFEPPSVRFWLCYNSHDHTRPVVYFGLYRIPDTARAVAAVNRRVGAPDWSRLLLPERLTDTSGFANVLEFTLTEREQEHEWRMESFTLPANLDPGFYILHATVDGSHNQMIIQITDLAVQIVAHEEQAIVWVNDMQTGRPAAGARVLDHRGGATYSTNGDGIAVIERRLSGCLGEHLQINTADGRQSIVFLHWWAFQHQGWWHWGGGTAAHNQYWTALQLDRTLFQRDDTLSLWGFVQNRRVNEDITYVTATITSRNWQRGGRDIMHLQNIPVQNGSYIGEINLPNLNPGSYELAIYHGDIVISSIFFTVQDYVTPPYQLRVSADVVAVMPGDSVTFTARTEFFEGTPVPDLEISYRFSGGAMAAHSGQARTDIDGIATATRVFEPTGTQQGTATMTFRAESTLPEIGWVSRTASVRAFINDMDLQARATRDEGNAGLSINIYGITVDRLNDRTAANFSDFRCAPVAGHTVAVAIYETYWERIRDGDFYCFWTRTVWPRYRHERREHRIHEFELTTDAYGAAQMDFRVPNRKHANYHARLTMIDGNGRTITRSVFIGRDWSHFHRTINENQEHLFLHIENQPQAGFAVGDEVELAVMRGADVVTQGSVLYVVVQHGILGYHVGSNPLTITFEEEFVPNARVFAFHFNGHTYYTSHRMNDRLRFDVSSRTLVIEIETCQDEYRPSGRPTLTITATDLDGNPKAANINISIVDEALFALMNYTVNTRNALYRQVSDNLRFSMATHNTFDSDGIEEDLILGDIAQFAPELPAMPTPAPAAVADSAGGADDHIRERFEDTAIFANVRTNEYGVATFTFQLPDNITSWRLTASGISDGLYAGNSTQNIRVTQPMFLHYSLNSMFLVGDVPYIGINAYGTSFTGGEAVTFEVWRANAPADIRRAAGVAFERVNIPLWEMAEEGEFEIIIRATAENGLRDTVRHSYRVLESHRMVDAAVFYTVTTGTVFAVGNQGMTNITFSDHGRGQFLHDLLAIRRTHGPQIQAIVARREADRLVRRHFPDIWWMWKPTRFNVQDWQCPQGGIAIVPSGSGDLQTTVALMPFIMNEINRPALRNYLQGVFHGHNADNKMLALYGLAMLGEPVLLDLQRYAQVDNLSVRNLAYVALGFAVLGETDTARELYTRRIAPHIQRVAPYYRVYTGGTRADILDATSVVALLAAQLGMPHSMGLHSYATRHRAANALTSIERLQFIRHEINNHSNERAVITYTLFGREYTRDVARGRDFTLRIPTQNMHEFSLIAVTGSVGAVSVIRTPLEEMEIVENDIRVVREFFPAGSNRPATEFSQGDLVRVQISILYPPRAVSGSYVVTDFLPAGLVHVANSARFGDRAYTTGQWRSVTTEGQRITFVDNNLRLREEGWVIYYYYARVISPGMFRAEGTMVQSVGAREYMAVGEGAVLTIRP